MSPKREVDLLVEIISDGVRAKMMRPKCLARSSWIEDDTPTLLDRLEGEVTELRAERAVLLRTLSEEGGKVSRREALGCVAVFFEACDVAAFAGMLVDPRRFAHFRLPHDRGYEVPP